MCEINGEIVSQKTVDIKIGKRTYPIEVENEQEEQNIRLSAEMINKNIDKLKGNYVVTDYVDLLAMTALEFASKEGNTEEFKQSAANKILDEDLKTLNEKLDKVLTS